MSGLPTDNLIAGKVGFMKETLPKKMKFKRREKGEKKRGRER